MKTDIKRGPLLKAATQRLLPQAVVIGLKPLLLTEAFLVQVARLQVELRQMEHGSYGRLSTESCCKLV